jgi:DNA-binding FadR family transcriptional regulator
VRRNWRLARRDIDAFVQHDVSFHERLGAATGNPLFVLIASALREAMATSVRAGMESRRSMQQVIRVVDTHQELLDAIVAGDPARARATMVQHFDEARRALAAAKARKE